MVCRKEGCCGSGYTAVLGGGCHSERGHRVPPVERGSGRSLGVLCHRCWPLLLTHTFLLCGRQGLLYLTGGCCLQPGHWHVKSQCPQHLIPRGQPLPVPIAWVTRVQRAGQSVAVLLSWYLGMCGAVVFFWHTWAGKDIIPCCCQEGCDKGHCARGLS